MFSVTPTWRVDIFSFIRINKLRWCVDIKRTLGNMSYHIIPRRRKKYVADGHIFHTEKHFITHAFLIISRGLLML